MRGLYAILLAAVEEKFTITVLKIFPREIYMNIKGLISQTHLKFKKHEAFFKIKYWCSESAH